MTDKASDRPAPEDVDRRRFLHRLSGEAVSTAGRLAGLSAAVRRSVVAAGQAAAEEFAPSAHPPDDAPTTAVREAGPTPVGARLARVADPPPGEVSDPPPAASPAPALTAEQDDLLRRMRSATLAVNDAAGPPHVTSSWFDWDGEVFRLPASLFTAKANNVARDPRVSLLIEDVETGRWVAATGTAEIIAGPGAADEARRLRAKYRPGEDSAEAWSDLYPAADGAVIVVRPTRFVWRMD